MTKARMSPIVAFAAGALFGVGLLISGMTQPARVIGFLDVTRDWDPTLAFVMAGAVAVYAVAYRVVLRRRAAPWLHPAFELPARRSVDLRLVAGAAVFGVGWGLVGLCPGPAIVSAAASSAALLFVVAMLAGMWLAQKSSRA